MTAALEWPLSGATDTVRSMPRPATGKTFVARARIPLPRWELFGRNVGDGNRSEWVKTLVEMVNLDPEVWKAARQIAEARGEVLGAVVTRALVRYVARNRHLLDNAEDE